MFRFNKEEIKVKIDLKSLNKSAIPLLIEDEIWLKLFDSIGEKEIIDLKTQLKSLVSENRKITGELEKHRREKRMLIAKILTLSEKINNNELVEGIELLEEYKENLNQLNDEIDEINFKSETLPSEIREINLELLVETIKYSYIDIIEAEENLDEIEKILKKLRLKLRKTIKEKYDYEEKRNEIYNFLHNALGASQVDKLDRDILD